MAKPNKPTRPSDAGAGGSSQPAGGALGQGGPADKGTPIAQTGATSRGGGEAANRNAGKGPPAVRGEKTVKPTGKTFRVGREQPAPADDIGSIPESAVDHRTQFS